MSFRKFLTKRGVVALAAAAAVSATLAVTLPATAASSPPKPVFQGARYLALGDSVAFGYREASNLPTPDYTKPDTFTGYPELVAKDLGLKLTNAACPGETSASMVKMTLQSNGCETQPDGSPGYRELFPLHVSYPKSQLAFAHSFLVAHPNTRLVTLMIGANDGFLCQETTPDHCTDPAELTAVLTKVARHVNHILENLRDNANYTGQIVIVNYYSLDYSDPNQNALSLALDQAIDNAAKPYHVRIAAGFQVFKSAARQARRSTCKAGLLTILQGQTNPCGVHPSLGGQALLASAVERKTIKS